MPPFPTPQMMKEWRENRTPPPDDEEYLEIRDINIPFDVWWSAIIAFLGAYLIFLVGFGFGVSDITLYLSGILLIMVACLVCYYSLRVSTEPKSLEK